MNHLPYPTCLSGCWHSSGEADVSWFSSVAQLCLTLQPHGLQHPRPPCPSPTPRVCSNSCPLSWWCNPTISSSVVPFSFSLQSFPASGSFPRPLLTYYNITGHMFWTRAPEDRVLRKEQGLLPGFFLKKFFLFLYLAAPGLSCSRWDL